MESGAALDLANCTLERNRALAVAKSFRGGIVNAFGGGIYVAGSATVTNCTIRRNAAIGLRFRSTTAGGGLYIEGTTSLTGCVIDENTVRAFQQGEGAGIYLTGNATLNDCTLSRNTARSVRLAVGGGMLNRGGVATISKSVINGNSCRAHRGGLSGGGVSNGGTMTLADSTVSNNRLSGSGTVNHGQGAGLINAGEATLTNCTLSGNTVRGGGGALVNWGTTSLTNCTLAYNTAFAKPPFPSQRYPSWGGGAILNHDGIVTLVNCTVSENTAGGAPSFGGGIETQEGYTVLHNTIIADNQPLDCVGGRYGMESHGKNLDGDASCFTSGGTDLVHATPMLAPLSNYGGPTDTMALCSAPGVPHAACSGASPAVDAGDDAVLGPPDNLTTDQRGLPRLSGAHVDIGAYEVQQ